MKTVNSIYVACTLVGVMMEISAVDKRIPVEALDLLYEAICDIADTRTNPIPEKTYMKIYNQLVGLVD